MDLSSQSSVNYAINNGIAGNTISSNNILNIHNSVKSYLPSSRVSGLRIMRESQDLQNKRSPPPQPPSVATILWPLIGLPVTAYSNSSSSSNNNNNHNNNNNTTSINLVADSHHLHHQSRGWNSHDSQQNSIAAGAVAAAGISASPTVAVASSFSSSSPPSTSTTSPSSSLNSGIGNDRVPCFTLNDDDRLPHDAQILADRYLLLNQIAGSSFFECVDIRTGDALTCKAIGNCYSKILSAYFRMDGDSHIKPLHKLLQASDQTYLLLPPSLYGDLHSYVRERRRLREPEARHLFRQICKTVKSCHQQGIVLRDLKLRKFVFSDCDRTHLRFESLEDAVVLDDPDDDMLKEKIGCPAYVAPEILRPNSDFSGKAADLWSLGVILYTMLVGRYPFNDPEHSSLFAKIARCQFTIPDYLSSKARCLIKSLLQKVPKHRLTSDDVLYHPWLMEDTTTTTTTNSFSSSSSNSNNSSNLNSFSISSISNSINSTSNNNNSSNYNDLSNDDQCVPEIDCLEFT